MRTFKKIDIYFYGDYVCSTNVSKTCKEALNNYILRLKYLKHSLAGLSLTQDRQLKSIKGLKASFAK